MRKLLVSSGVCPRVSVHVCMCKEKGRYAICTMWHSVLKTNEEKCVPVCSMYSTCTPSLQFVCFFLHTQTAPSWDAVLCNPNCMCFSFAQNNPKQLQGNSAQRTDKEPRVVSSGRTRSNPFQPRSIHYGITMITFWALCSRHAWIHPLLHSTTPSYNAVFICLATSNFQLDTVWCSNNHIS